MNRLIPLLLITIFVFVSNYSHSGEMPNGVAGIPFGASGEVVMEFMLGKGASPSQYLNTTKRQIYKSGRFVNYIPEEWIFQFDRKNEMMSAMIIFSKKIKKDDEAKIYEQYYEIINDLQSKYGAPTCKNENSYLPSANGIDFNGKRADWLFLQNKLLSGNNFCNKDKGKIAHDSSIAIVISQSDVMGLFGLMYVDNNRWIKEKELEESDKKYNKKDY